MWISQRGIWSALPPKPVRRPHPTYSHLALPSLFVDSIQHIVDNAEV
jgi:hypothetical protein